VYHEAGRARMGFFSSFAGSGAGAEVPKKFLKKDIVNPKSQRNVFDKKDGELILKYQRYTLELLTTTV
jgi:hypothetical protein